MNKCMTCPACLSAFNSSDGVQCLKCRTAGVGDPVRFTRLPDPVEGDDLRKEINGGIPPLTKIDPVGKGDEKIRAMLRELLESPRTLDACVVLYLFKNEEGDKCTQLDLRNTSDMELGYLATYMMGYAAERVRENPV